MRALPHAEVAATIRTVWASGATTAVKLAFEFLVLTAARSGEVRGARWAEIDMCSHVWVSGTTRTVLLVRRRWFPRGTEIDVGFGWAFLWHTDRTLLPDRRIGKVRHGSGLTLREGARQLAYEVLVGRPLTERVGCQGGLVLRAGHVGLRSRGPRDDCSRITAVNSHGCADVGRQPGRQIPSGHRPC